MRLAERKTLAYPLATRLDGNSVAKFSQAYEEIVNFGRCLGRQCEVEHYHRVSSLEASRR